MLKMCDFNDRQIKSFYFSCLLTIRGCVVNLTRVGDFDLKKLTSPLILYSFMSGDLSSNYVFYVM